MKDFFQELTNRQSKYQKLYCKNPNLAAAKLAVWSFQRIFKRYEKYEEQNKNVLNIAFVLYGGIGDVLVGLNYIKYFYNYINSTNINIDLYAFSSEKLIDAFVANFNFINNAYTSDIAIKNLNKYDVDIEIVRFPEIKINNMSKVKLYAPKLVDLFESYKKFYNKNIRIFSEKPYFDCSANNIAVALNKNRVQMPDIDNILNIDKNYKISFQIKQEKEVLKNFGLDDDKFITLNREVGESSVKSESTKMWSLEHYNELVKLIKHHFPEYKIVQLGSSENRSVILQNIDVNLVSKTSPEELKAILKNSILHIDGEGGLPHLRKILTSKPSVVLFTSTDKRVFGYENNFNLKADNACGIACEWVVPDWQKHCLRGFKNPPCSTELKPEYVFEKINDYLQTNYDKSLRVIHGGEIC